MKKAATTTTTTVIEESFMEILREEVVRFKSDHPEIVEGGEKLSPDTLFEMAHSWAFSKDTMKYPNLMEQLPETVHALLFPK